MTKPLDTHGATTADSDWLTPSASARRLGLSRSYMTKYARQLRVVLGGQDFQRGRGTAVKYRADLVENYRCARERYSISRIEARAELRCAVTPTTSTSKAGK